MFLLLINTKMQYLLRFAICRLVLISDYSELTLLLRKWSLIVALINPTSIVISNRQYIDTPQYSRSNNVGGHHNQ